MIHLWNAVIRKAIVQNIYSHPSDLFNGYTVEGAFEVMPNLPCTLINQRGAGVCALTWDALKTQERLSGRSGTAE